jgi:hypothetical protein
MEPPQQPRLRSYAGSCVHLSVLVLWVHAGRQAPPWCCHSTTRQDDASACTETRPRPWFPPRLRMLNTRCTNERMQAAPGVCVDDELHVQIHGCLDAKKWHMAVKLPHTCQGRGQKRDRSTSLALRQYSLLKASCTEHPMNGFSHVQHRIPYTPGANTRTA